MANRYLVFAGVDYESRGGWNDFIAAFVDLAAASDRAEIECQSGMGFSMDSRWAHVVDIGVRPGGESEPAIIAEFPTAEMLAAEALKRAREAASK